MGRPSRAEGSGHPTAAPHLLSCEYRISLDQSTLKPSHVGGQELIAESHRLQLAAQAGNRVM